MEIQLSAEAAHFVEEKVRAGEFATAGEVVEEAVRQLMQSKLTAEELNDMIAIGQADLDAGRVVDSEAVFEEIQQRSAARRAKAG
jgi:antitoxin ParD1/3/4